MYRLNLKRRIMARIYLEYTKNVIMQYPDYFMVFVFVVTSLTLVSFSHVISNLPKNDVTAAATFFWDALLHTSWVLQAFIVGFFTRLGVSSLKLLYKNTRLRRLGAKFNGINLFRLDSIKVKS